MIKVMADSGGTISYEAADIAASLNTFANNQDYVIGDIGNELGVEYTSSSLQVTFKAGRALICGRPVTVSGTEQITLPANNTTDLYLVLRVDLTQPIGQEGSFTYVTSGQIKTDNLNDGNGVHDLVIAIVRTNASGISSFTDKRSIKNQSTLPITIDSALSTTSTNPVQNKVINTALSGKAASSHGHGNITSGGDMTTTVEIASGDRLVINDESASKLNSSTITFGTSEITFLTNKGTWKTPAGSGTQITQDTTFNISGTTFKITTA